MRTNKPKFKPKSKTPRQPPVDTSRLFAVNGDVPSGDAAVQTVRGEALPDALADTFLWPVARLQPDPQQARTHFDQHKLEELAQSIRRMLALGDPTGVLQPLRVRPRQGDVLPDGTLKKDAVLMITAGERRWRAAQLAGLTDVPVTLRSDDNARARVAALFENVSRADLSPLEMAAALAAYREQFEPPLTMQQLAEHFGHTIGWVQQYLDLLRVHQDVYRLAGKRPDSVKAMQRIGIVDDARARQKLMDDYLRGAPFSEINNRVTLLRKRQKETDTGNANGKAKHGTAAPVGVRKLPKRDFESAMNVLTNYAEQLLADVKYADMTAHQKRGLKAQLRAMLAILEAVVDEL